MLRGHVFKFQTFANEVFAHFINIFLQRNMGITKGCNLSNTNSSVSIDAGYFCVHGRFLEIVGNETISNITNTGYYRLVCEIDLTKTNTKQVLNQAEIKIIRGQSAYPTLTQENLDNGGNVYQYEFARFRVTDDGITEFTDTRTFLNFESIYTQITNNFQNLFDAKSDAADALLQDIQDELDSIVDRSGLLSTNGGTIDGDLEVGGKITSDNLKNSNGSKYINQDNIVVIRGQKTLNANSSSSNHDYAQTTWEISYPTGFNKENCIVLAFQGNLDQNAKIGAYGVSPLSSSAAVLGTLPRTVTLQNDNINLQYWNPAYNTRVLKYTLVLMKILEPDINNYQMGDVNMDGQVTSADTDLVTGFLNGTNTLTDKQFKLADMNSDGVLDSDDIYEIQQRVINNS